MEKRMMSGNDLLLGKDGDGEGRWFKVSKPDDVDDIVIAEENF